ncbi:hypothetical protein [Aggregatibacter actinomycetemcomitans]|uniref:hypothetical protein n=1 Tax=Aggregatibacter actinomycetemcomitans TaxID=714 RepID=UPI00024001C2|nr:hypothetical protein [Aggregatibacter actinomycetemcomitans]EHK90229.1 hypothetical protein RHAA1_05618 [Aggregatibacter actinomycetemcomitans RhAA1]KNE77301.1 hypothetical protein RHAA2_05725 [Aggregatibacter actinomycetemcomitans RhAA1]MBN6079253.1 hypothetical protein [Aggregatibacter actinomycetemcomitans]
MEVLDSKKSNKQSVYLIKTKYGYLVKKQVYDFGIPCSEDKGCELDFSCYKTALEIFNRECGKF